MTHAERCRLLAAVLLAVATPIAADDELVFTRAGAEATAFGRASYTRSSAVPLTLPAVDCEDGRFTCTTDHVYAQVYSIDFELVEEQAGMIDGEPTGTAVEEKWARGSIRVAVELTTEDRTRFENELQSFMDSLGSEAYSRYARSGIIVPRVILQRAAASSSVTAWICSSGSDSRWFAEIHHRRERSITSYSEPGEIANACEELDRAHARPDDRAVVRRTTASVVRQNRLEVRRRTVSTIGGLTWADELTAIPDGVELEKRSLGDDEGGTGSIRDIKERGFVGREGRYGGIERKVLIPDAALDVVGMPMWATRWTFDHSEEYFGTYPRFFPGETRVLDVAILPVADPAMADLDRPATRLHGPDENALDGIRLRLAADREPGPETIERALADPEELWGAAGEWIVVTCHDDGSARYGLAPFVAAAEVTNARDVCSEIALVLED